MPRLISDNPLSPKERAVMVLVAAGLSNKEIGTRLAISEQAAKRRLQRACQRIGAANRTQAAFMAVREGWITVRQDVRQGPGKRSCGPGNEVIN